jgi:prolyl oligopeptidase
MITNQDAPRYRLMKVDLHSLPESVKSNLFRKKKMFWKRHTLPEENIFLQYLRDVKNVLEAYQTDGTYLHPVQLPAIGTVLSFSGEPDEENAYYTFTSFNYPTTVFRYNTKTDSSEVWFAPRLDFHPEDYMVEQVFYNSKDGTRYLCLSLIRKVSGKTERTLPCSMDMEALILP